MPARLVAIAAPAQPLAVPLALGEGETRVMNFTIVERY